MQFKSEKGTTYKRGNAKYPTGKVIGGQVYFHKTALPEMPEDVQRMFSKAIQQLPADTQFNTLMYEPASKDKPARIRFDESLDFDTAREPTPGNYISVDSEGNVKSGKTNQIFHHKWMWVPEGYSGFDVNDSFNWSKKWTEKISRPSGYPDKWDAELKGVGLDKNMEPPRKGLFDVPPENAQRTQRANTIKTYRKVKSILDAEVPDGKTLDFGAGLGLGAEVLEADSYEPFPRSGFQPNYTNPSDIPSNSYKKLTSLNVLNVVPREVRDTLVQDIGRVLEPGGTAVVQARDNAQIKSIKNFVKGDEPGSKVVLKSSGEVDTYQKGFSNKELLDYVQEILGDNFEVKPLADSVKKLGIEAINGAGVVIKKLSGPLGVAATVASMPTSAGELAEGFGIMPVGEGSDYVSPLAELYDFSPFAPDADLFKGGL